MRYPTVDEVIRINRTEVGDDLLADFGLLESAVLRPQTLHIRSEQPAE